MKTSSYSRTKVRENFEKFFDKSAIEKTAQSTGFSVRKHRKISSFDFVLGFILCCCKKKNTYAEWAIQIGKLSGKTLQKQSVFNRMSEKAVTFSKHLLEKALVNRGLAQSARGLLHCFGKVLLQDSTTLRLPESLAKVFPGNTSRGKQRAIARIQTLINVKAMKFIDFALHAFTQNDQSASSSILAYVNKGDLVIRDLGYFALNTFEKLKEKQVYFLSPIRYGVKLYNQHGGAISVKDLMQHKKAIDRWVYIGKERKVWGRLIMIPLGEKQAAEKRRKARHDRDKRLNHNKEYYRWIGYTALITSVNDDIWSTRQVAQVYKVRWQIEIIFKSWKSGFHLQALLHERCTNEYRAKLSIYLILLFLCLFMQKIYVVYKEAIEKKTHGFISLLKLISFVSTNFIEFFMLSSNHIKEQIALHCCYDKRYDRINMADLLQSLKN